jgi:Transcriptional regulators
VTLHTRSVVDAVEEALRNRILVGDEPPGAVVTEVGVAARFGVGRPTAKAAIDRLVADGLLIRNGRRGSVVARMGPDDLADLYDSRLLIERHAHVRLAAAGTVPAEAAIANAALRQAVALGDALRVVTEDIRFHRVLVEACGSPRLRRMHAALLSEVHVCMARVQARQLIAADTIADEHDEILRCLAAADPDGAAAATDAHLTRARDALIAAAREDAPGGVS